MRAADISRISGGQAVSELSFIARSSPRLRERICRRKARMRSPCDEASPLSLGTRRKSRIARSNSTWTADQALHGDRKKLNCALRIMVSQSCSLGVSRAFRPIMVKGSYRLQFWVVSYEKCRGGFRASFPPFAIAADNVGAGFGTSPFSDSAGPPIFGGTVKGSAALGGGQIGTTGRCRTRRWSLCGVSRHRQ